MPRDLHELPKLRDSLSYLYVERCRVEQNEFAIELWDAQGRTPVPVASLSVLMLGPGTTITHAAIKALADNGCTVLWCGEENVRFYAVGLGETRKAYRLLHQARCVCDEEKHREVAWRMYELRFGYRMERDISVNQMRGMKAPACAMPTPKRPTSTACAGPAAATTVVTGRRRIPSTALCRRPMPACTACAMPPSWRAATRRRWVSSIPASSSPSSMTSATLQDRDHHPAGL